MEQLPEQYNVGVRESPRRRRFRRCHIGVRWKESQSSPSRPLRMQSVLQGTSQSELHFPVVCSTLKFKSPLLIIKGCFFCRGILLLFYLDKPTLNKIVVN